MLKMMMLHVIIRDLIVTCMEWKLCACRMARSESPENQTGSCRFSVRLAHHFSLVASGRRIQDSPKPLAATDPCPKTCSLSAKRISYEHTSLTFICLMVADS